MKFNFKKTTSVLLAAAILVPSTCIVSYAEQDKAMTQAMTYVKQRIEIPDNLTGFTHSSRTVGGKTRYSFNWHTETDGEYEEINVEISGKVITSFDNGKITYANDYKLAELEPDEIVEKAKEAVKMLNPTVCKYIEVSETPDIYLNANYACVSIKRVNEGIHVAGSTGSVCVDKNTGELLSYNLNWIIGAGLADPEDAVSVETAQDGFVDEFPVELVYTTEYDWEKGEYIPHLIYRQTEFGEIDALTGKRSTYEDSYGVYESVTEDSAEYDDADEDAGNPNTGADVTFTESELEKLELEEKLIKADEAIKLVQDMGVFNIPDNAESTYTSCDYNDLLGAYVRYVSFSSTVTAYVDLDEPSDEPYYYEIMEVAGEDMDVDSASTAAYNPQKTEKTYNVSGKLSVDAETGEIISYYCSNTIGLDETKLTTEKKADKLIAMRFAKIAGDKAELFPTDNASITYSREYLTKEQQENGEVADILGATATINRYANGIKCLTESARITIDRNGKVSSYNMNYYGIEYPEPNNIITEADAYDRFFEQVDLSLRYRCALRNNKDVVTALVYTAARNLYIDAFTGKLTDSDGGEAYIEAEEGTYTDLDGSKYKKIAEKLAAYGITIMDEDGSLNEDKIITRWEFRTLAAKIGCYASIEQSEREKPLTRQYAAKIFASNLLNYQIAEMPIFKSSFSDVKETSKYVGYIEVACNLGYMSGTDGKFSPSQKITRGQALKMIYEILAD